jgi:predicted amidophosphoribosyltransferase|tara:strand:- start:8 stop:343 length:336 start_codon:yes stop_codon:yes gene_type:complete
MAHLFCHSCGNKLEYAHAKPNFCGKCGQQLNASVSTNTAAELPTLEKSVVLSSDETDAQSVPHISNFQVEYDLEKTTTTLGSLIGESPPAQREVKKTRSVNEFIDEKKKEG